MSNSSKVKKYLAKTDRAVDYNFYDDNNLRYILFKSSFSCRPLIGCRPPLGLGYICCCFVLLLVGLYARTWR